MKSGDELELIKWSYDQCTHNIHSLRIIILIMYFNPSFAGLYFLASNYNFFVFSEEVDRRANRVNILAHVFPLTSWVRTFCGQNRERSEYSTQSWHKIFAAVCWQLRAISSQPAANQLFLSLIIHLNGESDSNESVEVMSC